MSDEITITGTARQEEDDARPIWSFNLKELDNEQVSDLLIDAVVHRAQIINALPIEVLLHAVVTSQEAQGLRAKGAVELRIPLVDPGEGGPPPPVPGGVLH